MSIFTKQFALAALERAVKTAAQSALGAIGATMLLHEVDWLLVASAAGLATVASVLTSVASGAATGSPSLSSSEVLSEPGATADPVAGEPVEVEAIDRDSRPWDPQRARDDDGDGQPDIYPH